MKCYPESPRVAENLMAYVINVANFLMTLRKFSFVYQYSHVYNVPDGGCHAFKKPQFWVTLYFFRI